MHTLPLAQAARLSATMPLRRVSQRLRRPHARPIGPADQGRAAAEAFIRAVYLARYGARVRDIAPGLLVCESRGAVRAAAGWRDAAGQALFLEDYLDDPVEAAIGRATGDAVPRHRIAEIANLAANRAGAGLWLLRELVRCLDARGYTWAVFTATRMLRRTLQRLGLTLVDLGVADPARLDVDAGEWGSYYRMQPLVVACSVQECVARARLSA